ncbi:hypothetical protein IT41_07815 [Paracoccus halophilus]|uniref:Uncharacterized protein n=1 Tax=Paracoccus halophilus TaxID=376733 RepID=A0A099F422_9RHOB|nr:hypothetical protein IT41_07815 [Paracoccus halophilus]
MTAVEPPEQLARMLPTQEIKEKVTIAGAMLGEVEMMRLEPLDRAEVPKLREVMILGWPYLIPLIGLSVMLVLHYSPTLVAVAASCRSWPSSAPGPASS